MTSGDEQASDRFLRNVFAIAESDLAAEGFLQRLEIVRREREGRKRRLKRAAVLVGGFCAALSIVAGSRALSRDLVEFSGARGVGLAVMVLLAVAVVLDALDARGLARRES